MLVTLLGIVTSVRVEQSLNAESPIAATGYSLGGAENDSGMWIMPSLPVYPVIVA